MINEIIQRENTAHVQSWATAPKGTACTAYTQDVDYYSDSSLELLSSVLKPHRTINYLGHSYTYGVCSRLPISSWIIPGSVKALFWSLGLIRKSVGILQKTAKSLIYLYYTLNYAIKFLSIRSFRPNRSSIIYLYLSALFCTQDYSHLFPNFYFRKIFSLSL